MFTPTPTTTTRTRQSGETVTVTEWTIGTYTLRKSEEPGYIGWGVLNADRDLPRVEDIAGFGAPSEFGVSCTSISDLAPTEAVAWAGQIMEAAQIAATFNMIATTN